VMATAVRWLILRSIVSAYHLRTVLP
jgi:hypothetical protein